MAIAGYRLYKTNPRLHLAFICFRLMRDFGLTRWEVANFTGIPVGHIHHFYYKVEKILKSEVLKIMAKMSDADFEEWYNLPGENGQRQGYYKLGKDADAWYLNTSKYIKKHTEKHLKIGNDSQEAILKGGDKDGSTNE